MRRFFIAGLLAVAASGAPVSGGAMAQDRKAPELEGGKAWFNTDKPVRLEDLKGKIVLLDFWTFC